MSSSAAQSIQKQYNNESQADPVRALVSWFLTGKFQ